MCPTDGYRKNSFMPKTQGYVKVKTRVKKTNQTHGGTNNTYPSCVLPYDQASKQLL